MGLAGAICAKQGVVHGQSLVFMGFAGMLKWDYYWCNTEACVYMLTFKCTSLLLNLKGELISKNIKYLRSRLDPHRVLIHRIQSTGAKKLLKAGFL